MHHAPRIVIGEILLISGRERGCVKSFQSGQKTPTIIAPTPCGGSVMPTNDKRRKWRIAPGADFGGDRGDVIGSVIVCVAVGVSLLAVVALGYREHAANMTLTGIVAALLGWGAGLVATPYSSDEAGRISDISKVGYAALTGYLAAKFDKLFDALFSTKDNTDAAIFPYIGFGLAWFLLALLVTYYTRSYRWSPQAPPGPQGPPGPQAKPKP